MTQWDYMFKIANEFFALRYRAALVALLAGIGLVGPAFAGAVDVMATVDGHSITEAQLQQLAQVKGLDHVTAKQRKVLAQALIDRQLMADAAVAHKLDQQSITRAQLENAKTTVLARAALQQYLSDHPITDKQLHDLYKKDILSLPNVQYRISAIVTKTQAEAKAVRTKLTSGAKFAVLANHASILDHKKVPGGKLGWRFATSFLPPVAAAIETTKNGKPSAPVWTPNGWWIVEIHGRRNTPHKTFKQARNGLHAVLMQQRVQAYIKELRKSAKVSLKS